MSDEWDKQKRDCVEDWLTSVRKAYSATNRLLSKMEEQYACAERLKGIAYDHETSRATLVHGDDGMVDIINTILETVNEMATASVEYAEKRREFESVLSKLTHDAAPDIIKMFYIDDMTWGAVAEKSGYSDSGARKIRDAALIECYSLMPCGWRLQVPRADG